MSVLPLLDHLHHSRLHCAELESFISAGTITHMQNETQVTETPAIRHKKTNKISAVTRAHTVRKCHISVRSRLRHHPEIHVLDMMPAVYTSQNTSSCCMRRQYASANAACADFTKWAFNEPASSYRAATTAPASTSTLLSSHNLASTYSSGSAVDRVAITPLLLRLLSVCATVRAARRLARVSDSSIAVHKLCRGVHLLLLPAFSESLPLHLLEAGRVRVKGLRCLLPQLDASRRWRRRHCLQSLLQGHIPLVRDALIEEPCVHHWRCARAATIQPPPPVAATTAVHNRHAVCQQQVAYCWLPHCTGLPPKVSSGVGRSRQHLALALLPHPTDAVYQRVPQGGRVLHGLCRCWLHSHLQAGVALCCC
jgi:hypothetical protein